ncbi:GMC oxidoreductase [Flavilitoribacter nigricans]|uniref:GMC family oxidoreductase n=1 Tax=Flavilitoribacter nigricans (strain ATCC 23147 / DSM 23189 / NBRC 102662 / NCIMB 1420 / SS-2) TaxID=1122177 RepID=A0A2D0NGT0_FLAN2|nr:GMC family oxidoreductase [Flavilitoribacter nigricans]PHN07714.1 GMC family oxidoreductase [Flavilitoribacter nigricans DSM 23189 = NBRC 102662]
MSNNTDHHFDAIVIGAGMTGGWAAKEFCEKGLKTLLLERGRNVEHLKDYPTTNMQPWEFKHRNQVPYEIRKDNPVISRCYAFREDATHFFVKDTEHPYVQEKPFDWIRGYQVGGKSIMWARQVQRWSDFDFEGPDRDGFAVDWPIRYKDLADWYSYVEKFIGVTGMKDGLAHLPDGEFLKAWELNCVESYFQNFIKDNYQDRHVIYARCAHITEDRPIFREQGRGLCQARRICQRGCPFGGYFNANSTLIPWAMRTNNLTLRPHSVVHSIIFDEKANKATGVRIVDANTKETTEYFADVIFVNAAALNSNLVLLNSTSERFPNGLGNDNGLLGKYVAFHNYRARISAIHEGHLDSTTDGAKASSMYFPRFRNVHRQETDFLRGYAAGFGTGRGIPVNSDGFGDELRANLLSSGKDKEGPWRVGSHMMGATIPKETNQVSLDAEQKDEWGIPLLKIDLDYDDNDEKMIKDFFEQFTEMYEKAGFTNIRTSDSKQAPGLDIHEMGGVRMGHDPKTSLLNKWNQLHACPNVFVTDGACMTSTATQNPSLTYMALTARAANYAVEQMKKGELI